jgi:hypothetical protein
MTGSVYGGGKVAETVVAVRKRKGLKEGIPEISQYLDKL